MAGQTANYSFDYPTSTDYVKDGATAIETLADDVDATLFTALGGAYPGLRLIKSQTIGSGVSSVSVTGAFSSTYENYFITVTGTIASVGGGVCIFSFEDSGGTALTTGNYNSTSYIVMGTGSSVLAASSANGGGLECGSLQATYLNSFGFNIYAPNTTGYKRSTYISGDSNYHRAGSGYCNNATQFTRFRLLNGSGGTLTGGTIRVYGMGIS